MLLDQFGRKHTYLRLSLTERCNLRCFYCMPEEGIQLSPKEHLMSASEIEKIAQVFTQMGINKIRLTGGEPLVRKDVDEVLRRLKKLPVQLALTTNGILIDQYLPLFKQCGLRKINVSLDSLHPEKFHSITRRNYFYRVMRNIELLLCEGISPKINVVVIKGVNDDEIPGFISLTREWPLAVQFIEYMPFSGNKWDLSRCVSQKEILLHADAYFGGENIVKIQDKAHSTSRNYRVKNYSGQFGIISTITNPFCDNCNRIRLTANGRIKNCLFSSEETDLLAALRNQEDIGSIIRESIMHKKKGRGGINDFNHADGHKLVEKNRSMVMIGG